MNFISSIYLWLLPLISIPLLIYLFNRKRLKNITFSSLFFLEKIKDDSIKKINISLSLGLFNPVLWAPKKSDWHPTYSVDINFIL